VCELAVIDTKIVPDLETGYRQFRPLFFAAIARFVRQGVRISPADAMDFVHDFFAEEWQKVANTYDPQRGRFEPYVYSAFVNFVRPRVFRLYRLQRDLTDPDLLNAFASRQEDVAEPPVRLTEFTAALHKIPAEDRELLLAYLHAGRTPERMLAREWGIPRYRLREKLVAALGKLAISLGSSSLFSERDGDVAWVLWGLEHSNSEAARLLGMSEAQVRLAHRRNIRRLTAALQSFQQGQKGTSRAPIGQSTALQLLQRALASTGNREIHKSLRENAPLVLRALDEAGDRDIGVGEVDPVWCSEIFGVLLGGDTGLQHQFDDVFLSSGLADRRQVGDAFEQALLSGLPERLTSIDRWSDRLSPISEPDYLRLLQDPSVQASPFAQRVLARFGLTPMSVLLATDAVAGLIDRLVRKRHPGASGRIYLGTSADKDTNAEGRLVAADMLVSEITQTGGQDFNASRGVLEWCLEVGHYKPLIFNGWVLATDPQGRLSLSRTGICMDLVARWSRPAPERS